MREFHAQLSGPHLVLFSFRRFSRREMKIKETSTSPWSTRSWSTAALRFIGYPSAHPSAQRRVTQRRTTPRYRYRNGLRFRVCGASMLITIVCSTIRLKCTFINRIHRGYLSGRQREGGRTISPWKRLDLPREKRAATCAMRIHIPPFADILAEEEKR